MPPRVQTHARSVETSDAIGWGECVADTEPGFSEEWNEGAWLVIRDFLAPATFRAGDGRFVGALGESRRAACRLSIGPAAALPFYAGPTSHSSGSRRGTGTQDVATSSIR